MNRQELEALVIAKAREDQAFKQTLLNNPKAAIEQEQGEPLPANIEVRVLEENPDALYIVLPSSSPPDASSSEDFRVRLMARAVADETLKQQLLTNPKATVQTFFEEEGIDYQLSEQLQLNFLEETDNIRYLVLPVRQEGELSDLELEAVAGGKGSSRPSWGGRFPIAAYGGGWGGYGW